MIHALILGIHLLICVFLVLVVLLLAGTGGGLAGAFGVAGGAAQTLFGGRGAATFLGKATTVLGISFMTTSLILALLSGRGSEPRSVLRELQEEPGATPPPATSTPLEIPGPETGAPGGGQGLPGATAPTNPLSPGTETPASTPTSQTPAPVGGGGSGGN